MFNNGQNGISVICHGLPVRLAFESELRCDHHYNNITTKRICKIQPITQSDIPTEPMTYFVRQTF